MATLPAYMLARASVGEVGFHRDNGFDGVATLPAYIPALASVGKMGVVHHIDIGLDGRWKGEELGRKGPRRASRSTS